MRVGFGFDIAQPRSGGGAFNPASLFAQGEAGTALTFWRDFCFTRTVGGVYERVTTTGDAIARVVGQGNPINAEQTILENRPLYGESGSLGWGVFDGVNDFMVMPAIDFTATDEMLVVAGLHKPAGIVGQVLIELSVNGNSNAGSFYMLAPSDGSRGYASLSRGTAGVNASQMGTITGFSGVADTAVITATHDISGSLSSVRRNGVKGADGGGTKGEGNFENYPLYIGARAGTSLFYTGHLYCLLVRGKLPADAELIAAEKWAAGKTGVTL